jgi:cobalt-zinc-cadmium efflux system outer membrane protein
MRISKLNGVTTFITFLIIVLPAVSTHAEPIIPWESPFSALPADRMPRMDSLTFDDVLTLVAGRNPALTAIHWQRESTAGLLKQAGLRPNPEFEFEIEEFGGGAPGFRESEYTMALSQEFELWGKRKARKEIARTEIDAATWKSSVAIFDIYLTTRERFHRLEHAEITWKLNRQAAHLAYEITTVTRVRVEKGAALKSELLLSEIELEQANLRLAEAEVELASARRNLAGLWNGDDDNPAPAPTQKADLTLPDLDELLPFISQSREISPIDFEATNIDAQFRMESVDFKPNITLSGGYRRLGADGTGTFLLGISMPIPLTHRNQGNIFSLQARSRAIKSEKESAYIQARVELRDKWEAIRGLYSRYQSLDTLVVPCAEESFESLNKAYQEGRVLYLTLVEGERVLLDLRHELNNIWLEIMLTEVEIERLLGIRLRALNGQAR